MSTASGPAAGASAAACPAPQAGSPVAASGAAGPGQRSARGQPSPASVGGSAGAAPRLGAAALAAQHYPTPPNVPAAPSSRSGGRTSGKASVPSQARNAASSMTNTAGEPAGQTLMHRFGTLHHGGRTRTRPEGGLVRCLGSGSE